MSERQGAEKRECKNGYGSINIIISRPADERKIQEEANTIWRTCRHATHTDTCPADCPFINDDMPPGYVPLKR